MNRFVRLTLFCVALYSSSLFAMDNPLVEDHAYTAFIEAEKSNVIKGVIQKLRTNQASHPNFDFSWMCESLHNALQLFGIDESDRVTIDLPIHTAIADYIRAERPIRVKHLECFLQHKIMHPFTPVQERIAKKLITVPFLHLLSAGVSQIICSATEQAVHLDFQLLLSSDSVKKLDAVIQYYPHTVLYENHACNGPTPQTFLSWTLDNNNLPAAYLLLTKGANRLEHHELPSIYVLKKIEAMIPQSKTKEHILQLLQQYIRKNQQLLFQRLFVTLCCLEQNKPVMIPNLLTIIISFFV